MNQRDFMDRLERLLMDIQEDERREALQYYTDYFEDAGEENVEAVIRELGSPEKVAATIKADLRGGSADSGEFTETGYTDSRFEEKANPATRESAYKKSEEGYTYQSNDTTENAYEYNSYGENPSANTTGNSQSSSNKIVKIILIILIAIMVIPFAVPICIGIAAVIFGLIFASFGLFAGLVIGSIGIMFAGVALFILGMSKLLVAVPVALVTSGSGLLLFILGLIATVATIKLCIVIYPAMCRILVNICRWPFHRKAVS